MLGKAPAHQYVETKGFDWRPIAFAGLYRPRDRNRSVALVMGASRGIGRQIAIDLASNGYAVMLAAKTTSDANKTSPFPPDPNSSASTINTVEREIRETGGQAASVSVDVRDAGQVQNAVDETVRVFGKLDVLVYNSGAIWWSSVENTPLKRFKLMQQVNPEGLYATVQATLPHFQSNGWHGRIVVVAPPIYSRFFRGKTAYAVGKVGMSVLVKGLAMDFVRQKRDNMAITGIWPASSIESAATEFNKSQDKSYKEDLRKPYSVIPGSTPRRIMPAQFPILEVAEQDDEGKRMDSIKIRAAKI
ncbi:hypothetical protein FE257_010415 [Aspergillus nanangensis]|uniref:Short chain dehydrogenase family protein n=1 Tax=Aspergillus nanangensis TaxID=2582783 RepID=A0AAD4CIP1_ASPNN|nr:hypothetical protein FE257_010415 [Aspergillus nanangensis]